MTHRTATILLIIGGALMAVGSLLPWTVARTAFTTVERSGTDGDGLVTLGLGVLLALIGLLRMDRPFSTGAKTLTILLAAAGLVVVALDYQAIASVIGRGHHRYRRGGVRCGVLRHGRRGFRDADRLSEPRQDPDCARHPVMP